MTYDPEPPRCVTCDARLNPYGGGPCCNGVRCKLEEQERADLEPKEIGDGRFQVAA